jgi:hypothetical protein
MLMVLLSSKLPLLLPLKPQQKLSLNSILLKSLNQKQLLQNLKQQVFQHQQKFHQQMHNEQ